jgi:hypothetical protein
MAGISDPAKTYTLEDFVEAGENDEVTYTRFSIIRELNGIKYASYNILDNYLDELKKICVRIPKENITVQQLSRYKYNPDLLAYDIYGSTQLEFVVLYCNGIIDPKDFDFHTRYIYLPKASILREFLSSVYTADYDTVASSIEFRE